MARDEEFYEFAVAFPEALLGLLGHTPAGSYRASSLELKSSSRRVDIVLEPEDDDEGLIWVVEHSRRRDPDQDRNLLKKVVDLCTERDCWERVRCAVIFTEPAFASAVIPACVGDPRRPVLVFSPRHLVLPDISPRTLSRQGGRLLIALPLVGIQEEVAANARDWLKRIESDPALAGERERAREIFLTLLSDRLSSMDIEKLLLREDVMEHTATGQALIAKGIERGRQVGREEGRQVGREEGRQVGREEGRLRGERELVARLVRARLGEGSALLARLQEASRDQLAAAADLIASEREDEALAAALARTLPPA